MAEAQSRNFLLQLHTARACRGKAGGKTQNMVKCYELINMQAIVL